MPTTVRPTKKQRELLTYIEQFIAEHGYSPSYREIMAGLSYTSIATVALHVNNLVKRGHLQKRDNSARSLEVVRVDAPQQAAADQPAAGEERWLLGKIESLFVQAEQAGQPDAAAVDQLYVLVGALRVLGFDSAAESFMPRLNALRSPEARD